MRLNLKKLGEATAVGVIDIALEKLDETLGLTKPFNSKTIGRAAMFGAGVVLNAVTDKASWATETLYIASEPLLIRSIADMVGVITDAQGVPTRAQIEMRLRRQHGQPTYPVGGQGTMIPLQPGIAQFQ